LYIYLSLGLADLGDLGDAVEAVETSEALGAPDAHVTSEIGLQLHKSDHLDMIQLPFPSTALSIFHPFKTILYAV
jgi:hypothetical protein